jgi:site-specific DNA recombinase
MSSGVQNNHRRAIGIVRVSQVGGREGDSFASPTEQRERIEAACERDDLRLLEVHEELDVSGGTPLDKRDGLRRAVEAVESGEADVIVAAYFDRLVRSLRVQDDLVSRVEAAGGQVLAVDVGRVTNGSAGLWLSGTMLGAVSEYQRRTTAERTAEAQARAVARGVAPWPNIPPGYTKGEEGKLERDPKTAPLVVRAFQMRAEGISLMRIRAFLEEHGIKRSYRGIETLLASRVPLGEIHFGGHVNLTAHEPIVDRVLWQRVQRTRNKGGRRAKSDRLLARLDVLRCGGCGARMVVTRSDRPNAMYRCPPTGTCDNRATVSARKVEAIVTDAVREALSGVEGRASAEQNSRDAERELAHAQGELDAALRVLADFSDEAGARARLEELRDVRDRAQDRVERLGGARAAVTVTVADWDRLTLDERRALIRATVESVTVAPGQGAGRVSVRLIGE